MAKFDYKKYTKLEASTFRGWLFVIVAGVVLATIALIDRGGTGEIRSLFDGSTGCVMQVVVSDLNVRSAPGTDASIVQKLVKGDKVDGTRVLQAAPVAGKPQTFRQLRTDIRGERWALDSSLTPVLGTNCG